ncbi:MAG: thiolase C-terminal domain-containing protein [Candidatus Bathyarchaeia archaeon]
MRGVAIAGFGLVKIGEHWNKSIKDLFAEASLMAMDRAEVKGVDHIYVANMAGAGLQSQLNMGPMMAHALGLAGTPATRIESGSASGGLAFHEAVKAVSSGINDIVLVGGVEKMTDGPPEVVNTSIAMEEDQEYTAYTGITKIGLSALLHRLYMNRYNVPPEDVAMMAVKGQEHAVGCGHAQYPFKLSVERVMSSPMEADPIHMMECSGIGDGAAALVLCPADQKSTAVEVASSQVSTDAYQITDRDDPLTLGAVERAADRAYNAVRITPGELDLAEVHDDVSINGILSIESLGLAERGEGARLVAESGTDLDERIPVNTFGGLKARGNPLGATGLYQLVEVAMQLEGIAGKNQVDGAEVGLAQNMGGTASICTVNILRRTSR